MSAPVGSLAFGKWYARADRRCANNGCGALRLARIQIRTPAIAATDKWPLAPELAAGIARVKNAKSISVRTGKLAAAQPAQALPSAADLTTTKRLRAGAIIAVLLGCALRRAGAGGQPPRTPFNRPTKATGQQWRLHGQVALVSVVCTPFVADGGPYYSYIRRKLRGRKQGVMATKSDADYTRRCMLQ